MADVVFIVQQQQHPLIMFSREAAAAIIHGITL
jgi:hypothetical protein